MKIAADIFKKTLIIASKTNRNFIIDQTNVFLHSRIEKIQLFESFRKEAVVVVVSEQEQKKRMLKKEKILSKNNFLYPKICLESYRNLQENFVLPDGEGFDSIIYPELEEEKSRKLVYLYNMLARKQIHPLLREKNYQLIKKFEEKMLNEKNKLLFEDNTLKFNKDDVIDQQVFNDLIELERESMDKDEPTLVYSNNRAVIQDKNIVQQPQILYQKSFQKNDNNRNRQQFNSNINRSPKTYNTNNNNLTSNTFNNYHGQNRNLYNNTQNFQKPPYNIINKNQNNPNYDLNANMNLHKNIPNMNMQQHPQNLNLNNPAQVNQMPLKVPSQINYLNNNNQMILHPNNNLTMPTLNKTNVPNTQNGQKLINPLLNQPQNFPNKPNFNNNNIYTYNVMTSPYDKINPSIITNYGHSNITNPPHPQYLNQNQGLIQNIAPKTNENNNVNNLSNIILPSQIKANAGNNNMQFFPSNTVANQFNQIPFSFLNQNENKNIWENVNFDFKLLFTFFI